jgi:hypothetical protein
MECFRMFRTSVIDAPVRRKNQSVCSEKAEESF